jgi:DNA polymerase
MPEETINQVHRLIAACEACPLNSIANYGTSRAVYGDGTIHPELLVIGEAPGEDEARLGIPFIGRSGTFLRTTLYERGADRSNTHITNVVKHRPPGNRDPELEESNICVDKFLVKEIELLKPKAIICVGRVPTFALIRLAQLAKPKPGSLRGLRFRYNGIPVISTWHPAYVLRNRTHVPETVEQFVEDIESVLRIVFPQEVVDVKE